MALSPASSRSGPPFTLADGAILSADSNSGGELQQWTGGELDLVGLTASGNAAPQLIVVNDNAFTTFGKVAPTAVSVNIANVPTFYGGTLGVMTAAHSAPADGSIVAGQCYLWFDQTDGVGNTKLMVKAKSANGTVKTATIVLA